MRILLVGGKGGREHALATKLARSPLLTELHLWPGSPVTAPLGKILDLPKDAGWEAVAAEAARLGLDLVVSGPETPLSEGLADRCRAAGVKVFGPTQNVAALESSKEFSKAVMAKAGIPTAAYVVVRDEAACRDAATRMLARSGGAVLKASGLAAGKGVFVCKTAADVEGGLRHLYHTDMRQAADAVVVEEILEGRECSYFTFIGDGGATGLGFAVDFMRLADGDAGPNTGGMGCYAPVPWLPRDAEAQVVARVVEPLLATLDTMGTPYVGCLYVGVMWSETKGPQVVEFNVRLGDPEAQVLAAYDDRDWLALMASKAGVPVAPEAVRAAAAPVAHADCAVCVTLASASYPFGSEPAEAVRLPRAHFGERQGDVIVFGASLDADGERHVRTGRGRVMTVAGRGPTFSAARAAAYARVRELTAGWPGVRYRNDIGARVAAE
jgi:phosphoribosylamine--glycine ligase